jgi:anti-anti-sigma factor
MRIEETQDDVAVISLVGELDLGTAPRIERRMFTEIRRRRAVVVDLSELRFIDSSGIGLLIHAHRAREDGKAAELHAVVTKGSQVAKVFDLAGVDRALAVHSSQAEALAALNGRVPG